MSVRLTVLGNINIDFVVQTDRLPKPGETLRSRGDFNMVPGGKAANQAVAASRLGAQVTLIGRVGNDAFGPALVENLRRENINTDFIVRDEEANTGAAFITVIPSGENSIVSALGANNRCSIKQVEAAATEIERSELLLVQLGVPAEVVDRAIQIAVDRDVLVQLDPSPLGQPLPDLWRRTDVLVPNQTEASEISGVQITDIMSTVEAAQAIRSEGITVVVITLGPSGCLVASEQGIYRVDGFPVEPVDATAAGDSFAGALATALAEGMPMTEAAVFANAAGALATTIAGAQPSLPHREAVDDFLMQRGGIDEVTVEEL